MQRKMREIQIFGNWLIIKYPAENRQNQETEISDILQSESFLLRESHTLELRS